MSTSIDDQARARIAARYPTPRRRGRSMAMLAVLLAVGLVGWIIWAGLYKANPGITGQLQGYTVTSPTSVEVTVIIDRPDPTRPGSCDLQAIAASGEVVGEKSMTVTAQADRSATLSTTITTYLPATTAVVTGCSLD